jgi:hypothetical protein
MLEFDLHCMIRGSGRCTQQFCVRVREDDRETVLGGRGRQGRSRRGWDTVLDQTPEPTGSALTGSRGSGSEDGSTRSTSGWCTRTCTKAKINSSLKDEDHLASVQGLMFFFNLGCVESAPKARCPRGTTTGDQRTRHSGTEGSHR